MSKKCNHCGMELDDTALFCPECGTKQVPSTMKCPQCGASLPSEAAFCPACGASLRAKGSAVVPAAADGAFSLESLIQKKQQEYSSVQQKVIGEERKRLEEEARRKAEEEARKAEGERLRREEEERKKAEAKARREEAKRKKEEEERLKREEEERLKAEERARKEEERRKKEEEKKKKQEEKARLEAEHPEWAEERKRKQEEKKKQQALKEKEAAKRKAAEEAERKAKEAARLKAIEAAKKKVLEDDKLKPVDLGLSVKWASLNVGASNLTDRGGYYAWGETETKDVYDWEEYELSEESSNRKKRMLAEAHKRPALAQEMLKYCTDSDLGEVDDLSVLMSEDDAAAVNMRSKLRFWEKNKWRMATIEEWNELKKKCEWVWTSIHGCNGYLVIAKNGNCIFLPAAGYKDGNKRCGVNEAIHYWSSSLDEKFNYKAHEIKECPGNPLLEAFWDSYRFLGLSIRAVQE